MKSAMDRARVSCADVLLLWVFFVNFIIGLATGCCKTNTAEQAPKLPKIVVIKRSATSGAGFGTMSICRPEYASPLPGTISHFGSTAPRSCLIWHKSLAREDDKMAKIKVPGFCWYYTKYKVKLINVPKGKEPKRIRNTLKSYGLEFIEDEWGSSNEWACRIDIYDLYDFSFGTDLNTIAEFAQVNMCSDSGAWVCTIEGICGARRVDVQKAFKSAYMAWNKAGRPKDDVALEFALDAEFDLFFKEGGEL